MSRIVAAVILLLVASLVLITRSRSASHAAARLPGAGDPAPEAREPGVLAYPRTPDPRDTPVATFSIIAYDPETGEFGGAVQSRVFSVGNGVLWAEADVGVVATQAYIDVSYGPRGLAMLRENLDAAEVTRRLLAEDPDPRPADWPRAARQFAVVDSRGDVSAHTGPRASDWAGHRAGRHVTAQGNILAGPQVVDRMIEAFERTPGHLAFKLMAALEAGQEAGGDTRGIQSAAILIVGRNGGVWLNNDVVMRLQVDDHPQPIAELRRLVEMAADQQPRLRHRR